MATHNINELLELKKELEAQVEEVKAIEPNDFTYKKEVITDHTNNTTRDFASKDKKTLVEVCQKISGLVEKLSKVKTAIAKFNAKELNGKLAERDQCRTMIHYLDTVKKVVPRDSNRSTKVLRKGNEGETLESAEIISEPFFKVEEVEKIKNEWASKERKLNTEIQKINLNATIEL